MVVIGPVEWMKGVVHWRYVENGNKGWVEPIE